MFVAILGLMDLIIGTMIGLEYFSLIGWNYLVFPILYLISKFLMFPDNFASYIELLISVYLIFSMLGLNLIIQIIFSLYMIEKGVQSIILSV